MKALYDLPAPAKLNLFLHVVGKRADGYHLLQSIFVPIDWQDTLHLERRDDGALQRHDLSTALPADDLCLRAARLLQAASGCTLGADISIDKQIPSGAGMGGGSSDAATVLIGLNRLWGLDWTAAQLMPLALQLGADVPFFLGTGPAWVEGIGEQLTPIDVPATRFAVLKPPASLPTQAIFESPLLRRSESIAIVAGSSVDAWRLFKNDMQDAASEQAPQVLEALQLLQNLFGNSRMTGSGSAVFSEVRSDDLLREPLGFPGDWSGRICNSLASMPLSGWIPS